MLEFAVRQGEITLWMFLVEDGGKPRLGGGFYLHDQGVESGMPYAWLGTYVLPAYRNLVSRAWRLVRQTCSEQNLHRFFAAVRRSNRPVQLALRREKFLYLGTYTDWSYFEGKPDTVALFSQRQQDRNLAWVLAEQRSQTFRQSVSGTWPKAMQPEVIELPLASPPYHRPRPVSPREHAGRLV